MEHKKELKDLVAGDKVIVRSRYGSRVVDVAKVTKTMVVLKDSGRYRINNGSQITTAHWNTSRISIPTDEKIEEITKELARQTMAYDLTKVAWSKKDFDYLSKVKGFIKKLDSGEY
jgi:hypothetical protein